MGDEEKVMVSKDPSSFGRKKFHAEIFITERHVVTVYADSEWVAHVASSKCVSKLRNGGVKFNYRKGVSSVHYDADYGYNVRVGEIQDVTTEDV